MQESKEIRELPILEEYKFNIKKMSTSIGLVDREAVREFMKVKEDELYNLEKCRRDRGWYHYQ